MLGKKTLGPVAVLGLFGAPSVSADTPSFKVQFAGCTEFVGWGPVSLAAAEPVVPAGYVIAGATHSVLIYGPWALTRAAQPSSSKSAFASLRSAVSKPSVNQP